MKAASVNDLKKELKELPSNRLVELCLQLAKYKKDNKELLGFLLFESHDKTGFVNQVKQEMAQSFSEIDRTANLYYTKKSLRKILRQVIKYCRYLDEKALAADLHIYFCRQLLESGIPFRKSQLLINLYDQELKRITAFIGSLHEDLQSDYSRELESLYL